MKIKQDLVMVTIVSSSAITLYCLIQVVEKYLLVDDNWLTSLLLNSCSYSVIVLSGWAVFRYAKSSNYLEECKGNYLAPLVRSCFFGNEDCNVALPTTAAKGENFPLVSLLVFDNMDLLEDKVMSETKVCVVTLLFCFVGLFSSYLTWGILQEKIMTTSYTNGSNISRQFTDSQFLVFVNMILAACLAGLWMWIIPQPIHKTPLYKYSFCSLSNTMSSWCQYEALKFISFPTHVLAKASKVIPVMLMSWFISGKTYSRNEYLSALLISIGMALFLTGNSHYNNDANYTSLSGYILLVGYMVCDAFTSNWQKELFNSYNMTSVQAMFGPNLFSCLFTMASLLEQQSLYASLLFMSEFPGFLWDCIILSLCSAVGQLFICHTINVFGIVWYLSKRHHASSACFRPSCFYHYHDIETGLCNFVVMCNLWP